TVVASGLGAVAAGGVAAAGGVTAAGGVAGGVWAKAPPTARGRATPAIRRPVRRERDRVMGDSSGGRCRPLLRMFDWPNRFAFARERIFMSQHPPSFRRWRESKTASPARAAF